MKSGNLVMGGMAVVVMAFLLAFSSTAYAVPITAQFEGTIGKRPVPVRGTLDRGATIQGAYTFESDTPDSRPNPTLGLYLGGASAFSLSLAGVLEGSAASSDHRVLDDRYFARKDINRDAYILRDVFDESTGSDFTMKRFGIRLVDFEGDIFSSDALLNEMPSLEMFDRARWWAVLKDASGERYRVGGRLTSFDMVSPVTTLMAGEISSSTPVPEPATLLLLGTGLSAVVIARRRSRK